MKAAIKLSMVLFLAFSLILSGCKNSKKGKIDQESAIEEIISSEDDNTVKETNKDLLDSNSESFTSKESNVSNENAKTNIKAFVPWESKTSYSDMDIKNRITGKNQTIIIDKTKTVDKPDLVESDVRKYLSTVSDADAAAFWNSFKISKLDYSVNPQVFWESDTETHFTVAWSLNRDFSNAYYKTVDGYSTKLEYLVPGEIYYCIIFSDISISSVATIKPVDLPVRWVKTDGASNMRDIGGWKTENGQKVKYGMLYRSACIDGYNGNSKLTSRGIDELNQLLHINSEIDLRSPNHDDGNQNTCIFGGNYFKNEMTQYDRIFESTITKKSLKNIFDELSKEENYPVLFHCNAGADRTGTLAFILNGVLGVSYNDLTKDFELSTFSGKKRLRGELSNGQFINGVFQNDNLNYIAWGDFYKKMMADYGTGDKKLSSAIENFLISECSVSKVQINTFVSLMTE